MPTYDDDIPELARRAERLSMETYAIFTICAVATLVASAVLSWLSAPQRWPVVTGRVLSSLYIESGEARGPHITYEYEVDGVRHYGDRLSRWTDPGKYSADRSLWPWQSRALIAEHPDGSPIGVHVHPFDPATAYITTTIWRPGFIACCAVVVVGWGAGWVTRRRALELRARIAWHDRNAEGSLTIPCEDRWRDEAA